MFEAHSASQFPELVILDAWGVRELLAPESYPAAANATKPPRVCQHYIRRVGTIVVQVESVQRSLQAGLGIKRRRHYVLHQSRLTAGSSARKGPTVLYLFLLYGGCECAGMKG